MNEVIKKLYKYNAYYVRKKLFYVRFILIRPIYTRTQRRPVPKVTNGMSGRHSTPRPVLLDSLEIIVKFGDVAGLPLWAPFGPGTPYLSDTCWPQKLISSPRDLSGQRRRKTSQVRKNPPGVRSSVAMAGIYA